MKNVLYILGFVLVSVFINGKPFGYFQGGPVWSHFTYMFFHPTIIGAALTSFATVVVYDFCSKLISWKILLPTVYIIGVIASFFSEKELPTIGLSGITFALYGIYTVILSIRKENRKNLHYFLFVVFVSLLVGHFLDSINNTIHLVSYFLGIVSSLFIIRIKK